LITTQKKNVAPCNCAKLLQPQNLSLELVQASRLEGA